MRHTRLFIALFAITALSISACTRVEVEDTTNHRLVNKTFSAAFDETPQTLAVLGSDHKTSEWVAGDFVAVYDDVDPSTPHKFTAKTSGATATFEGVVNAGATKFYAVYPYDACVTFDNSNERFTVQIPQVQYAVKDGFDPRANVAAAYSENDEALLFRLVNGLVKFTVSYDNIVMAQLENTSRYMTGYYTFDVQSAESGKIANVGDGNLSETYTSYRYKNVSLKNEDGSPLENGASYYIVTRQSSNSNPYVSPKVSLISADAKMASKSSENGLVVARKSIINLGSLNGLTFSTSRYGAYMAGLDIDIAGTKYNISTHGNATLLSASGADNTELHSILRSIPGVFFLESDGHNFTTTTNSLSATGDHVIIANSTNVTFKPAKAINLTEGSLVMKGIDIDATGFASNIISNGAYVSDPTALVFEDCSFIGLGKQIFNTNSNAINHGINKVVFNRCKIEFTSAVGGLINIGKSATSVSAWKELVFTNNIVYSKTGANLAGKILNCEAAYSSAGDSEMNLKIENCVFHNIAHNGSLFSFPSFAKINIKGVLQFASDGTNVGGDFISRLFLSNSAQHANSSVSNFAVYGALTNGTTPSTDYWTLCNAADRIGGITNDVTVLDTYPFASATPLSDGFTLIDTYKSLYGPQ